MNMNKKHLYLLGAFLLILIWSAINPKDYFTWVLEVAPGVIGVTVLILTYKRFKFTDFVYVLILIHCFILFFGGKYTYAENPLFEYFKITFDLQRNNYDKLGHFAQGFVPSLIVRELFIRLKIVTRSGWMVFLILSVAMFISSVYELIEWLASILTGESAEAFLGTQGYIWDTQSDMLFALLGSLTAIVFFSKIHDRYIRKMQ